LPSPTPGGAGDDQIARLQRDIAAGIADDFGQVEDHRLGVAGLHPLAIDVEIHRQVLRIGDLLGRHQPRADRAEGVMALALRPLRTALLLVEAFRHVIGQHVTGDVREGVLLRNIARGLAHDEAQLDFPVRMGRPLGQHHEIIGPGQAGDGLHEHHRLGRDGQVRFDGMVAIVETNGHDLADALDRYAIAHITFHHGQALDIHASDLGDGVDGDVGNMGRQVADLAVGVDQAGLFSALGAVTNEFHVGFP
jgi:hypothetical protein